MMSGAPHEGGRHLDQRAASTLARMSGQVPVDRVHTAACQLQTFVERVDARIFRGDAQRASSSMSMPRARDTPFISAASASTPDPVPTSRTAAGGSICMPRRALRDTAWSSGAVRCRMPRSLRVSGRLVQPRCAPELSEGFNRTGRWAQDPDRVSVSVPWQGDRDIVYAEGARDLFWCNAVGHQGRDPAVVRDFGIEAPSSTSRSNASSPTLRRSTRYGTFQRNHSLVQRRPSIRRRRRRRARGGRGRRRRANTRPSSTSSRR